MSLAPNTKTMGLDNIQGIQINLSDPDIKSQDHKGVNLRLDNLPCLNTMKALNHKRKGSAPFLRVSPIQPILNFGLIRLSHHRP